MLGRWEEQLIDQADVPSCKQIDIKMMKDQLFSVELIHIICSRTVRSLANTGIPWLVRFLVRFPLVQFPLVRSPV